ncbi:MAG: hypothetical protein HYX92_00345, partial [Chloroflexi bacterium]|nr:hypothetical protein [Chloroflexota bacterium]
MKRFRGINIGLALALVLFALLALVPLSERTSVSAETILASSTFDSGNEGWKKVSHKGGGPFDSVVEDFGLAEYESSGGNPGGHIATDDRSGDTMWFEAPGKFLGDKSGAYGGALSYDLKLSGVADRTRPDVALLVGG